MLETKKIYTLGNEEYISDLCAFGWEITESSIDHVDDIIIPFCILARNKEMLYYDELNKLEIEYETERQEIVEYDEINIVLLFLLLLLGIIPGIIYIIYKSNQKQGIIQYNEQFKAKMRKIVEKAKGVKE